MFSKKKTKEEKYSFRWSEQSSLTDNRQHTLQVALITSIAKKYVNDSNDVKAVFKMDTKGVCT